MDKHLIVTGGKKLQGGKISIAGSSNQVTKCILAALLTNENVTIKGAPVVNEKIIAEELFQYLGGRVEYLDENTIRLCAKDVSHNTISKEICRKNRISILAAGPLLHRFKRASLYATLGGDKIGKRPVDFHIKGLEQMGALVVLEDDLYHLSVDENGLQGAHIILPFPSVMTTENLIIAATLAKGRTIIENAAIEPEITELVKMLQKMGADIMINANRTYVIQGVKKLRGCELRIMLDRNQAVSFACAALVTGGNVLLEKMPHDSLYSFLNFIQRMGAEFKVNSSGVYISAPKKLLTPSHVEVEVHPGFMTDWQQPFMVLLTQAKGISILHETIFENRLNYTNYLNEMGANIHLHSACLGEAPCRFKNKNHTHSAIVYGPTPLVAKDFTLPTDIRAAMSLVIAGLVAKGTSKYFNVQELQRKYDNIVGKLQQLGADVSWGQENMGRHNTVAGRMAESAASRGRLFTKLARAITVAARSGSDPNANSALRTAIAKAKDNSMPRDNIDRAIKNGSGEGKNAAQFEEMLYEGFGPGGAGILVEVLTDNRNRVYPELRVIFQKNGGNLGEVGSISWMFQKKGVFIVDATRFEEDRVLQIALESGADDVENTEGQIIVTCPPTDFAQVREDLLKANIEFMKAGIEYLPDNTMQIQEEHEQKMKNLLETLDAHDDVQNVYTNVE